MMDTSASVLMALVASIAAFLLRNRYVAARAHAERAAAKAKQKAADDELREKVRQAVDAAKAETKDDDLLSFYAG